MRTPHVAAVGGRRLGAGLVALTLAVSGGAAMALPAQAAPSEVDDATLTWTLNDETGGGAFFGGCNFLIAGAAGDAGGAKVWGPPERDAFYETEVGNVMVQKPAAGGGTEAPTWDTKCKKADGSNVTTQPGSTHDTEVVISGGAGTVDVAAGTAEISWDGDFTVVFYGGMTYWIASDPQLSVAPDGSAVLTATGSGWGADMDDLTKWVPLEPREIELATLSGVDVDADGFTVTPDYLGVEVESSTSPQVRTGDHWGAFPQSFVDFQVETGQSSYWYSSGGSTDPKKPADPLTVGWTAEGGDPEPEPEPGEGEVPIEVEVPEDGDPGEPGAFSWTIQGTGAVNLGTASGTAAGFAASGQLHPILVEDTRAEAPSWSISGQASAFADGSATFGATALGWTPAVTDNTVGAVPGPQVPAGTGEGLGVSRTLASAASGHSLGSALVQTSLELLAPGDVAPGSYTSTLTLTALG